MWREELIRRFPKLERLPAGCFVVGGAIRDLLLGREPLDVDVACIDPLAAAKSIRPRVIRLGADDHLSAWRVVDGEHVYDFAEMLDHELDADLARRDFTINSMAVSLAQDTLFDPHGGRADLEARVVRMVQPSNFDDDPLRTLKGVRMAVKYGFEIEGATMEAIRERAPRIFEIAAERVTYELSIIFSSNAYNRAVQLLDRSGLAAALGLAVRPADRDDLSLAASYALLVEDPRSYAKRWKWSAELRHEVLTLQQLIASHDLMSLYDAGEKIARQLVPLTGAVEMPDFTIRPFFSGDEIAAHTGLTAGRELGRVKRALLEAQVRGDVRTRDEARAFVVTQAIASR